MATTRKNTLERNRDIFIGYYLGGISSKDLSITHGISRQAVEKIVRKILEKRNNNKEL